MKKVRTLFVVALVIASAAVTLSSCSQSAKHGHGPEANNASAGQQQAARVPAHFEDAQSARPLKPTLAPEMFNGRARQAYQIAREIPETLAQLPCYCYCDQGFGHKSLHSCYESDHSAHCATCVDEALLAYQLEKEQGYTPAQIREKIVERYARH
jgi:hypothetical protein